MPVAVRPGQGWSCSQKLQTPSRERLGRGFPRRWSMVWQQGLGLGTRGPWQDPWMNVLKTGRRARASSPAWFASWHVCVYVFSLGPSHLGARGYVIDLILKWKSQRGRLSPRAAMSLSQNCTMSPRTCGPSLTVSPHCVPPVPLTVSPHYVPSLCPLTVSPSVSSPSLCPAHGGPPCHSGSHHCVLRHRVLP